MDSNSLPLALPRSWFFGFFLLFLILESFLLFLLLLFLWQIMESILWDESAKRVGAASSLLQLVIFLEHRVFSSAPIKVSGRRTKLSRSRTKAVLAWKAFHCRIAMTILPFLNSKSWIGHGKIRVSHCLWVFLHPCPPLTHQQRFLWHLSKGRLLRRFQNCTDAVESHRPGLDLLGHKRQEKTRHKCDINRVSRA